MQNSLIVKEEHGQVSSAHYMDLVTNFLNSNQKHL